MQTVGPAKLANERGVVPKVRRFVFLAQTATASRVKIAAEKVCAQKLQKVVCLQKEQTANRQMFVCRNNVVGLFVGAVVPVIVHQSALVRDSASGRVTLVVQRTLLTANKAQPVPRRDAVCRATTSVSTANRAKVARLKEPARCESFFVLLGLRTTVCKALPANRKVDVAFYLKGASNDSSSCLSFLLGWLGGWPRLLLFSQQLHSL